MKTLLTTLLLSLIILNLFSQDLNHELDIKIDIENSYIHVEDKISFSEDYLLTQDKLTFTLQKGLELSSPDKKVKTEVIKEYNSDDSAISITEYKVYLRNNNIPKEIRLVYEGEISDDIEAGAAEYARGFSETSGTISEKGIYLAGSSFWIPGFNEAELASFNMNVEIDSGWTILSQGTRTIDRMNKDKHIISYESPEPMDEIYLVGGKWTEYSQSNGRVLFQAFLRSPDGKLAMKYLGATQGYLAMYEKMIGPYPFTKFALVENFWETGYGMPSFTLLGPKVIRFPWILHSSYPHELLHNYWGNSVYVDYETGNWCEGITVYMADHLLKEQLGQGAEYRQATLQKYTDYVNPQNDFPVSEFLSRNNSAEEAIGYGKAMMINNMLRYYYGDKTFLKAYSKFYNDYKFKKAGFNDIKHCFEEITGDDLSSFFNQWIEKAGAPSLSLSNVEVTTGDEAYELTFRLSQIQKEETFELKIPVYIYLEGSETVKTVSINMNNREKDYSLKFREKPVRLEIDPTFQIFRRLDRNEVPTTLTQLFGASDALLILPSESPYINEYKAMAEIWKATQEAQDKNLKIVKDSEIGAIPADITTWVLGFENIFAEASQIPEKYFNKLSNEEQASATKLKKEGSLVYAIQNPENQELSLGFMASNNSEAIAGLTMKLLHYGKYSYLGFEGKEPVNILKGIFPALGSPLNYAIPYDGIIIPVSAKITARKALTE